MRIQIRCSSNGWDVVQGGQVLASTPTRSAAIQRATELVRATGQLLQIVAEPERAAQAAVA